MFLATITDTGSDSGKGDSNVRSQSGNLTMTYLVVCATLNLRAYQRGREGTGTYKNMEKVKTLLASREGFQFLR